MIDKNKPWKFYEEFYGMKFTWLQKIGLWLYDKKINIEYKINPLKFRK
jgi:hypothetical protein